MRHDPGPAVRDRCCSLAALTACSSDSTSEPGSAFLDHNLIPGQARRLYLLENINAEGQPVALAIEVVEIKDAGHLAAYSKLVEHLQFDG